VFAAVVVLVQRPPAARGSTSRDPPLLLTTWYFRGTISLGIGRAGFIVTFECGCLAPIPFDQWVIEYRDFDLCVG